MDRKSNLLVSAAVSAALLIGAGIYIITSVQVTNSPAINPEGRQLQADSLSAGDSIRAADAIDTQVVQGRQGVKVSRSTENPLDSWGKVNKANLKKAPEFAGITGYINTEELHLADLRGKVVLVDFWTYSCINCINTIPHVVGWHEKYTSQGLVIVGVHTPEFEFEKNPDNVRAAVEKFGIKFPVLQDNDYQTWRAYENRYWPRFYLVDTEGYIRYSQIGEGNYSGTEAMIVQLLKEA